MKKAILVGIDNYGKSSLKYASNDAKAVASLLEKNGDGGRNFDVRFYKDVPTKADLNQLIHEAFKEEDENSLFYFAGHGCRDSFNTYLVTPDSKKFDLGVSLNDLLVIANASKARNKIIILDCCYSGSAGTINHFGSTTAFISTGVTILAACKSTQESRESQVSGHGIFTNLLLEALKGGAADIGGYITLGSIYAYIDKALGAFTQRPVFKTNISGFFPLRRIEPRISPDVLRKIADYFPGPYDEYALNPSYEDTNIPENERKPIPPFADKEKTVIFKHLQQYQSMGLVMPVNAPFMYFAAMESKACKLTPLGQHYWHLTKHRL